MKKLLVSFLTVIVLFIWRMSSVSAAQLPISCPGATAGCTPEISSVTIKLTSQGGSSGNYSADLSISGFRLATNLGNNVCLAVKPNLSANLTAEDSKTIRIQSDGTASTTVNIEAAGNYPVDIYSDNQLTTLCATGEIVISGPSPTPQPTNAPNCLNEGESCPQGNKTVCTDGHLVCADMGSGYYCDSSFPDNSCEVIACRGFDNNGNGESCIPDPSGCSGLGCTITPLCQAQLICMPAHAGGGGIVTNPTPTTEPTFTPFPSRSPRSPFKRVGGEPRCSDKIGECRASCESGEREVGEDEYCVGEGVCCVSQSTCFRNETYVATFDACYSAAGFINTSLEWLMIAAALLALFRFTVGGIQYIFSQGQPDKLESAQQTITSAVFGLVLVFIAWVLIQFVGGNTPDWWDINFFSITSP